MSTSQTMPAIFAGHGSPMNAIERNRFSETWQSLSSGFPKPEAILAISAHWVTAGTCVNNLNQPETIYDMYGFPRALYEHKYVPPGAPLLASQVMKLLGNGAKVDNSWGIDHGTWSVLTHMYPKADIPTMQLSLDMQASMEDFYQMGRRLRELRDQGVLILGSGNVVHNLSLVEWGNPGGESWADAFDLHIKSSIMKHDHQSVVDYHTADSWSPRVFVTTEHYAPLPVVLGSSIAEEPVTVFNEARIMGSLSMTGYKFG